MRRNFCECTISLHSLFSGITLMSTKFGRTIQEILPFLCPITRGAGKETAVSRYHARRRYE